MTLGCTIDQENQQYISQENEIKNYGDNGVESALKEGIEILKKVKGVDKRLYEKFKREYDELYRAIKESFDDDKRFSIEERNKIKRELEDLRRLSSSESIWDLTKTKDVHFILELLKDKSFPKNTHFEYFDDEVNLGETISNFEGEDLVKLYKGVPNFERNMLIVINNDDTGIGQYILKEFIEKIKPIDPNIARIFERNPFEKGKIPDLPKLQKLLESGNYEEIHKKILLRAGELGMAKDPAFKTEVVDVIVDFFDKNPKKAIDYDMKDFIKFFDCNSPKHVKLAKKIQEILVRDIKNGINIIGDTYLLSFSIKSGFPLTEEVIRKELGNVSEAIKKLGVEINKDKGNSKDSNIGYFAHFLTIINGCIKGEGKEKEEIKKVSDSLYKIHYEMSSIGSLDNFKIKLNNSKILERTLTNEELNCLDYETIGGFLKSVKPYLKNKNIDENSIIELTKLFEQISKAQRDENIGKLSQDEKDIMEKGKILSRNVNGEYEVNNQFLKNIIKEIDEKSKDKKIDIKSLINQKLKENGIEGNEKLINFIEKEIEIERKILESRKILENKDYRKLYISYANGEISDKDFADKKAEIDEKINNSQNNKNEVNKLFDSIEYTEIGSGNYEISIGIEGEKLELTQKEFDDLKGDKEALTSVIDFYKKLKNLGLDFVWKYREYIFNAIQNFSINGGVSEEETKNLYNFLGKQIGKEWKKIEDAELDLMDLRNGKDIGCNIKGEDLIPPTSKLSSSQTSTIFAYLKKDGYFNEKFEIVETKWTK